jgi:GNAT superfamily N-acetyltransferase
MIEYTAFGQHSKGLLFSLFSQSYTEYFFHDPGCREAWRKSWENYDKDVFQQPNTVGACGFLACLNGKPIGFASWDPRLFPDKGIVEHNCILPEFQGNSHGKQQLAEVLRLLREQGFWTVRATTGEHLFFEPARRMYLACGFREVGRGRGEPCSKFGVVEYKLSLLDQAGKGRA